MPGFPATCAIQGRNEAAGARRFAPNPEIVRIGEILLSPTGVSISRYLTFLMKKLVTRKDGGRRTVTHDPMGVPDCCGQQQNRLEKSWAQAMRIELCGTAWIILAANMPAKLVATS